MVIQPPFGTSHCHVLIILHCKSCYSHVRDKVSASLSIPLFFESNDCCICFFVAVRWKFKFAPWIMIDPQLSDHRLHTIYSPLCIYMSGGHVRIYNVGIKCGHLYLQFINTRSKYHKLTLTFWLRRFKKGSFRAGSSGRIQVTLFEKGMWNM